MHVLIRDRAILACLIFEASIAYQAPFFFTAQHSLSRSRLTHQPDSKQTCSNHKLSHVESCWFPLTKEELDFVSQSSDDGSKLSSDHPGFHDLVYRERRKMIAEKALRFHHGDKLPNIDYTETEHETWGMLYEKLRTASRVYGVDEYNAIIEDMEKSFGYGPKRIPQLQEVSDFLESRTGWTLRPARGLLPARSFLNGLALRVFHSTQYLRHGSRPLYTPEPDIVHELVGHAPLLADPDFAALSQEIGLASLGASDSQIKALAACYWFSVEFGLSRSPGGGVRAYGAGVLSSLEELLHACGGPGGQARGAPPPELRRWRPAEAAGVDYPITTLQPRYYVASSLSAAKAGMRAYCRQRVPRPFAVRFDASADEIVTDRPVRRGPPPAAPQGAEA